MKEDIQEKFFDTFEEVDDLDFGFEPDDAWWILPISILGLLDGISNTDLWGLDNLLPDGGQYGYLRAMMYLLILLVLFPILGIIFIDNPAPVIDFILKLIKNKFFIAFIISDTFVGSWLTYPLANKLGCLIKHIFAGVAALISIIPSIIREKKKDRKHKKEIVNAKKMELEKELAKDYIVSPEVMEYTKSNRRKEIEDYKKLREEYAPTIPTEVVAQNDKVLGLK